ncbi:unnamed protein product [Prorocentrum cordatum]|uniref:Uncharacterized protein n=1 Tax=Prorocentrum cordatum TaxID=2364126 RepID=A0ABN9T112_9DINO|nr:unnamed protein product [Polarella glacialis]
MECFPSLLPSYAALEPAQRATILFTQSRIDFNNGWFVQGEAPPGAMLSTFKRVIVNGGASEADISFYFAHWITDLAGAVPYGGRPWPGAEKFALQFPHRVLGSFLKSFAFVDRLASVSEVDVMEAYLQSRWSDLGLASCAVREGCRPAARRLALMAQGFEAEVVHALHALPPADSDVIALELARTGHSQQFDGAPPALLQDAPAGPSLLVYYAPALIQKAGASEVRGALHVLAAVYRAARELFPCSARAGAAESCAVVRIDLLKVLGPQEIAKVAQLNEWHLRKTSDVSAEVVLGPPRHEAGGPPAARIGPLELCAEAV